MTWCEDCDGRGYILSPVIWPDSDTATKTVERTWLMCASCGGRGQC